MKKKELISRAAELLRKNDIRKSVPPITKKFTITDDNGKTTNFKATTQAKGVLFTAPDVAEVLDALLAVAVECVKNGDELSIKDFGSLGVRYRAARSTRLPVDGGYAEVKARYVPKFKFGNSLRMAAKMYELSLEEKKEELEKLLEDSDEDEDLWDDETTESTEEGE